VNSLVLLSDEVCDASFAILEGERAHYAFETHGVREGQSMKVAVLGGLRGEGRILSASPEKVTLALELTGLQMDPIPVTLVVGVSRPQTVKKVIQAAVMFGVSSLHFVRSAQGEKSYLQSRSLDEDQIQEETLKALEQVWDSRAPQIVVHRTFSYFMENKLPEIVSSAQEGPVQGKVLKLIAHPGGGQLVCSDAARVVAAHSIIAVGPERGWSHDEVDLFQRAGFGVVGLGERVVRVELALVFLLGKLALLRA
jgi:RsmE family RNA methyltransferase